MELAVKLKGIDFEEVNNPKLRRIIRSSLNEENTIVYDDNHTDNYTDADSPSYGDSHNDGF